MVLKLLTGFSLFSHKGTYQSFVDSGDLTVLYVSIDKQEWGKNWRQSVKYNQLEGYHVQANDVLIKDMWNFFGELRGAIPRYALLNKKGEVFVNDAASPSQIELLQKQINDLVSITKE